MFPGADEKVSHGRPAFFTKKVFAYYGYSVKVGAEWVQHPRSVVVLPADGERDAVLSLPNVSVPAYLGPTGWIGYDLAEPPGATDWDEVWELIADSFARTAPAALRREWEGR